MQRNLIKTMDYSHGFDQIQIFFYFSQKGLPSERASQEEQNGTTFSFIAPSSE